MQFLHDFIENNVTQFLILKQTNQGIDAQMEIKRGVLYPVPRYYQQNFSFFFLSRTP